MVFRRKELVGPGEKQYLMIPVKHKFICRPLHEEKEWVLEECAHCEAIRIRYRTGHITDAIQPWEWSSITDKSILGAIVDLKLKFLNIRPKAARPFKVKKRKLIRL